MKNILMVAYHFPPFGRGSGRLRTLKLSKYLLEYDWKPHVLTLNENVYAHKDETLLRQIPAGIKVIRTPAVDIRHSLAIAGKYPDWLCIPDSVASWIPFAVREGLRIIRREGIDVIYTTSPMATAHVIGWILNKRSRVPWISDFRDPWIEEPCGEVRSGISLRINKYLEKQTIINSNAVVATTDLLKRQLMQRYTFVTEDKFHMLPNGFDEEDFRKLDTESCQDPEGFEIIHTGGIDKRYRSPMAFLRAVRDLLDENTLPKNDVKITFLGPGGYCSSQEFRGELQAMGILDVVDVRPGVAYEESLRSQQRSAVLLLLQSGEDTRMLIPAKAFEYLRTGRPILCLTLEGATSQLMEECDAGIVVHPNDIEGIKTGIMALYRKYKQGDTRVQMDEQKLMKYSRRALAGRLAALLNHVARQAS